MTAINLQHSLKTLHQCLVSNVDGAITLDKSLLRDNLAFDVAMYRVTKALEDKEITLEYFMLCLGANHVQ